MKLLFLSFLIYSVNGKLEPKIDTKPRIFGGEDAEIEEFPSVVAIIHLNYGTQWCAGTFISETWILTAAHCQLEPHEFVIEYDASELWLLDENAKLLHPELFISHERYNEDIVNYDIALIKTRNHPESRLSDIIVKLAIPGSYFTPDDKATVVGWGIWSNTNNTNPPLQKADLIPYDSNTCQKYYMENPMGLKVFPHQICAGVKDFSKAECNGDSGGPLFIHGIQVGIVSWSVKPCTVAAYPGVYTDVRHFISWIQEKTGIDFISQSFLIRRLNF